MLETPINAKIDSIFVSKNNPVVIKIGPRHTYATQWQSHSVNLLCGLAAYIGTHKCHAA